MLYTRVCGCRIFHLSKISDHNFFIDLINYCTLSEYCHLILIYGVVRNENSLLLSMYEISKNKPLAALLHGYLEGITTLKHYVADVSLLPSSFYSC